MAERFDRRDDNLERALRALGADLAYPPTPDLARAVRARLATAPTASRRGLRAIFAPPAARRLALALLVLLALVGAALALSPGARRAIAGRLGVPGITIEYATPAPTSTAAMPPTATRAASLAATPTGGTAAPTAVPTTPPRPAATPATPATPAGTPAPGATGLRLGLGRRVTLAEARAGVGFPVQLPSLPDLGEPDEIYLGEPPSGGQVSLVWFARPGLPARAETGVGLLITQFRADLDPGFFKKVPLGTTVLFVAVNGTQGFWLEGDPHEFFYTNPQGTFRENLRLAGNVLIWSQNGVTHRIEGADTLARALQIAASLR